MYLKIPLTLSILLILTSNTEANVQIFKQWQQMDYYFPSPAIRQQAINSGNYVPENIIPIDVSVDYRDTTRVFITMPRFTTGVPASLGYTKSSSTYSIIPYPSYDWHSSHGKNCEGITSVFRVAYDGCNQMWVLDTGKIGDIQYCQPQLLIFNLITDKLVKRYRFNRNMYVDTSLFVTPILDVADPGRCTKVKAYIADVTGFGLVVYDLEYNKAWRINNKLLYPYPNYGKFTIAGESFDLMDGLLAMTITKAPLRQDTERSLLFHALASATENSVPLRIINNATIWENDANAMPDEFKVIGTRGIQTGAQAMDKNGNLFFVLLNPLAIVCWDSSTSYKTDNIKILYRNDETLQFASGMKVVTNLSGEEELWLVTNRLQKYMSGSTNLSETNFRILVASIRSLLNFKDKCNGSSLRNDQTIVFPDRNSI
ncbi:dopaminechrome tautomerase-like isoform X2 [Chironomus tepperi]|uniref:dopaminechrome tautomerase-like isoform X2 n=1 Tax=Chironomus tepperi TaxID=113505 RepID=UPI00391F9F56